LQFAKRRAFGAWLVACALLGAASYPFVTSERAARSNEARLSNLRDAEAHGRGVSGGLDGELSLRVARLDGVLASWETIGGCGAGTMTGAGGGIKWIGRSATGGLFQLQSLATYTHLADGYNLTLNTIVSRDLGEKWNVGLSVPLLYKYYRNIYGLPSDVSNSGVGDIAGLLTRRFGEINDTSLTLLVAAPTGVHDATFRSEKVYLTQEKQLGGGKVSGSLTLDHTIDKTWGVIVLGGSFAYRGGKNDLGSYRAPAAVAYGYTGYFAGPWVPSLGLSLGRFFGIDRDRGIDQQGQLWVATGTLAVEWSNDSLALLAGVSLPVGWQTRGHVDGVTNNSNQGAGLQPWTAGLGLTISPF